MKNKRTLAYVAVLTATAILGPGCTVSNVDFSTIHRPARAPQLDAFDAFVGSWNWQATVLNTEGEGKEWSGTADWQWTLDKQALHGRMTSSSGDTRFEAAGIWSWHPKHKRYIWWMFNNWGYPQEGTARYDCSTKTWRMDYTSVGLDGTTSHGRYWMTVADKDTLDWRMEEWADVLHMIKKLEMKGRYTRK